MNKQLDIGTIVESEHKGSIRRLKKMVENDDRFPSNKKIQRMIAKDHLIEDKDYYKKLKKCGL